MRIGAQVARRRPHELRLSARSTCEPTELASRIGAMRSCRGGTGGGTPEVDPMAHSGRGSALRSGEDDGGDDDDDDDNDATGRRRNDGGRDRDG